MDVKSDLKAKTKVLSQDEIKRLIVPGELGAILELTVKDKNGKVTDRRVQKSESFVRQFLEMLWICFGDISHEVNPYLVRDTDNFERAGGVSFQIFNCDSPIGNDDFGILIGTDNTAPTINDYHLGTKIIHGVGAGQLQYSGMAFGAPADSATESHFTLTRDFANGSGGAIVVNECGPVVKISLYNTVIYNIMTARDVIAGGMNVPNGQTLTINYRMLAAV